MDITQAVEIARDNGGSIVVIVGGAAYKVSISPVGAGGAGGPSRIGTGGPAKKRGGRPKGSKNKPKEEKAAE